MPFDLLDDRVYPETRLRADAELLDRFLTEQLELVASERDWLVYRLKEAGKR
jgi:hypothetical protein